MKQERSRLYQYLVNNAMQIIDFYVNPDRSPLPFSIVPEERIDQALDCLAMMQKYKIYDGQKIGIVNPDIPGSLGIGTLRRGQVVLYKDDHDNRTVTVEEPFTLKYIKENIDRKAYIFTSTIINVPSNHIRSLVPEE